MRNLIRFLLRYNGAIVFIVLEFVALLLVFQYNHYQKAMVVTGLQNFTGYYHSKILSVTEYLNLRKINENLAIENARINNILQQAYKSDDIFFYKQDDTVHRQQYYMTTAKVINNSTNKQFNFLTLNKGSEQGIQPEMAVVATDGVVGVVYDVSRNFATVVSLLNTNLKISARLEKNDYFGSLSWDGARYRNATLHEIPYHVDISMGDSIVTSGYSAIFPEGLLIGTITDFQVKGGNFYEIKVRLSADFKSLTYVNVISNLSKQEQKSLENQFMKQTN